MPSVARPTQDLKFAITKTAVVKAAKSVTANLPITLNADGSIQNSVLGDQPFGIAQETGVAGASVSYWILTPSCILPVKVSPTDTPAVGVARGALVEVDTGNDGVSTAQTPGGGTTVRYALGRAYDPGIAGDIIGVVPQFYAYGSA